MKLIESIKTNQNPQILDYIFKNQPHLANHKDDTQDSLDYMDSLLHIAVKCNNKKAIEILTKYNAKLNVFNKSELTPLELAVGRGYYEIAEILLKSGAKVKIDKRKSSQNALHIAVRNSRKNPTSENAEFIEKLINSSKNIEKIINEKDNKGRTALDRAVKYNNLEATKILINNGANIEIKNDKKRTALHYAAINDHTEITEILIKAKANIEAEDHERLTPLHYAAINGHIKIMEILLKNGAELEQNKNPLSLTPLHQAIMYGNIQAIEFLTKYGADINREIVRKFTILHHITIGDDPELDEILVKIAEILITKYHVNIEAKDEDGRTPLHHAVINGNIKMVKIFLKYEANIEAKDQNGKTPLDIATDKKERKIIKLFEEHKVNITKKITPINSNELPKKRQKNEINTDLNNHNQQLPLTPSSSLANANKGKNNKRR